MVLMYTDDPRRLILAAWLPLFEKLAERLAAEPWWKRGWISRTGHFDEGIYFQIYKPGWQDESLTGVHLETWITIDGLMSLSLPVVLHVEPGTPERDRVNALLVERASALMAGWPGRTIPVEHDPTERYSFRLSLTRPDLLESLVEEFRRMAPIDAIIDAILEEGVDRGSSREDGGLRMEDR